MWKHFPSHKIPDRINYYWNGWISSLRILETMVNVTTPWGLCGFGDSRERTAHLKMKKSVIIFSSSHHSKPVWFSYMFNRRKSYRFWTTWEWVNNDRVFIFGWTIPEWRQKQFFHKCWLESIHLATIQQRCNNHPEHPRCIATCCESYFRCGMKAWLYRFAHMSFMFTYRTRGTDFLKG